MSALVAAAEERLRDAAPPSIVAHAHRTYLLAAAHAERAGLPYDDEGLHVAALFHDIALCPAYRRPDRAFAGVGAELLHGFLAEHGVTGERADRLATAVALHMRPWPVRSAGVEAELLRLGAWGDVVGLGRRRVRGAADAAARAHPRGALTTEFARLLVASTRGPDALLGLVGVRPRR